MLTRLRHMTRDEVRWRASVAVRRVTDRLNARERTGGWRRGDIASVLAPEVIDADLRARIAAADWPAVHRALCARLIARPSRFVLDPASIDTIRRLVTAQWPSALSDARTRADRIVNGRYDLLGYRGLEFAADGNDIDWHFDPVHNRRAPRSFYADVPYLDPAVGDHKIIWELNRHQHWLPLGRAAWLTGDPRYATAIARDLESWLTANPPLAGINWASMLEIGFRAISWTWAAHNLLGMLNRQVRFAEPALHDRTDSAVPARQDTGDLAEPAWLIDLFVGLDRQLTHLEHNLSYYFSPNTHLTGEALGLYVVGTALPELARSGRWAATGKRILLDEIDRQIDADGGHAERSTHYQRYTLDFYLLALLTARLAHDPDAEVRFRDAARRLAEFTRVMADDNGRLPLLGDDDGGMLWPIAGRDCNDVRDSLSLAAVLLDRPDLAPWGVTEEAVWISGTNAVPRYLTARHKPRGVAVGSRALTGTGYFVARDDHGGHAVFDGGAHGYMNGGHAHADALSIAVTIDHRPLLIDPGTSTYTCDAALRDRLRSSVSHNTVTIDGRSQSIPFGPFHWRARADARLHEWRTNPSFDWVEASHDGYAPVQHRRTLLRTDSAGWLIVDEILGTGRHSSATHWHFDPAWTVTAERGRLRVTHDDGDVVWLAHDDGVATLFRGDEQSGLGWFAPVYGTLVPAWTARILVEQDSPQTHVTWIGSQRAMEEPVIQRVTAQCDAASAAIAAQVTSRDRSSIFMLRPGGRVTHAARTCRVVDFETDGRVLHYQRVGDRLVALDLVDASYATTQRQGWISLEADGPIADLHLAIDGTAVDLRASAPPPLLRLRGAVALDAVRLNGRELPLITAPLPALLLIHDYEWRSLAPPSPLTRRSREGASFAEQ
jgi:hypothetical protein